MIKTLAQVAIIIAALMVYASFWSMTDPELIPGMEDM